MHYSSDLKATLSASSLAEEKIIAELYGFLHGAGNLSFFARGRPVLSFSSDNASVARRYYGLIKDIFGYTPFFSVDKSKTARRSNRYRLDFTDEVYSREILSFYNLFSPYDNAFHLDTDPFFLTTTPDKTSYLKGLFLGCGYISPPKKSYHIQFSLHVEARAKYLIKLLTSFDVKANMARRGKYISVYIKNRESIAVFFALIGAHQAMLDFENILILKDIRNSTTRLINSETANIHKTINSAEVQMRAIGKIAKQKGLTWLKPQLYEAAQLRLAHPTAPLSELCEYFSPKISRTAAYNRYKKILTLADEL